MGVKGLLDGTPTYNDDLIGNGTNNKDQINGTTGGTGQSYTTLTSISETAANLFTFTPTVDPVKSIDITVIAKGTGNWTLTLHDSLNNVIGTKTTTNANITAGAVNNFQFATAARVNVPTQIYHVHVTSTVADGTINVKTAGSLATAAFQTYFQPLIADADYHPMYPWSNGTSPLLVIGNNQYLATYDGVTMNPCKITLAPGYKVRLFTQESEFLVAMAWKGTNIDDYETGIAYYWDGIAPLVNYAKPITAGSPNASINFKNRIFSILGSNGEMALGTEPFRSIQFAPKLTKGKKVEVLPRAIGIWRRRVLFGYSNSDDNTNMEQGIYEFGNQSDRAITYTSVSTEVLNYSYQISTGTAISNTLKIGAIYPRGKDLYYSWKDNTTYGVDKVSNTNNPAATGSWESLIIDQGIDISGQIASLPQKTKKAIKMVVTFATLPTGCTVVPKYRIERAASFTLGTAEAVGVAGQTRAEFQINKRYREIEIGFDLTATVNYPFITGVYLEYDPLVGEFYET